MGNRVINFLWYVYGIYFYSKPQCTGTIQGSGNGSVLYSKVLALN